MSHPLNLLTQLIYSVHPPDKAVLHTRIDKTGKVWRVRLFALPEEGGEWVMWKGYMNLSEIKKNITFELLRESIEQGHLHLQPDETNPSSLLLVMNHNAAPPLLLPLSLASTHPSGKGGVEVGDVNEEIMDILTHLIELVNAPGASDRAKAAEAEDTEEEEQPEETLRSHVGDTGKSRIKELEREVKSLKEERDVIKRSKEETDKQLRLCLTHNPSSITHPAARLTAKPQPKGASLLQPGVKKGKKVDYGFEDDDDE